jgi:excinuclease ABC subunit C
MGASNTSIITGKISALPDKPGVYQFFDKTGRIIYIGKAKSLKKRVGSYFNRDRHESGKTHVMVRQAVDLEYIVVQTELDALLLENNLIKRHQPRYNVLLKDDKTYPWICIKNERFPRVFSTRSRLNDGSDYFGPYASVKMVNTLLELTSQLYKLRNCNLQLSEENIRKRKFRVCLEYHIGNCKGPCEGLQSQADYDETIAQIKDILKGNIHSVISHLRNIMQEHSSQYDFENALLIKQKLDTLEKFKSKSVIVNANIHNVDVFSIIEENGTGYVNFMNVANGAIVQAHTLEMKKKMDETLPELLSLAIGELMSRYQSDSKEIIVPFHPDTELPGITVTIPQIGDKKHLLALSEKNLKYYISEITLRHEKANPELKTNRLMTRMQEDLRLPEKPLHIECFDNSNIQGAYPVAAMSVFKSGKPSRKDYRHFNIKTVEGPDDFASMEEVIFRRYKRCLEENADLPQLIIIDGGKGQLSSAMKSIKKLGLEGKINILGIAKKLEEIFFPGDPVPVYLDKRSESLHIIQQLRDEAHRFGITHHRKRREKGTIKSELTSIKGISFKTAQKLLWKFKSVKKIKEAALGDLELQIGKLKGRIVFDHFHEANRS